MYRSQSLDSLARVQSPLPLTVPVSPPQVGTTGNQATPNTVDKAFSNLSLQTQIYVPSHSPALTATLPEETPKATADGSRLSNLRALAAGISDPHVHTKQPAEEHGVVAQQQAEHTETPPAEDSAPATPAPAAQATAVPPEPAAEDAAVAAAAGDAPKDPATEHPQSTAASAAENLAPLPPQRHSHRQSLLQLQFRTTATPTLQGTLVPPAQHQPHQH